MHPRSEPFRAWAARRRPTMDDVAAVAGVSRGTVSRALSGGQKVSPAALKAIYAAVEKTGYVVNPHARSLASQRAGSVAFVLCAPPERLGEDPGFNLLLTGCTQALSAHGITMALLVVAGDVDRRRAREQLTGGRVDGVLLVSVDPAEPLTEVLVGAGLPTVVCGPAPGPEPAFSHVRTDDRAGARQLVRYLRESGRKTIATIAGPDRTVAGAERLAGWTDALGSDARQRLVAVGDYTCAGGRAAMERLLAEVPELDAVFVASDLMAAGALAALHRAGRRVPDDVAVAGFEDSAVATTVQPALTTVRRPLLRLGLEMVRLLLDRIDGAPADEVVFQTELVVRESA